MLITIVPSPLYKECNILAESEREKESTTKRERVTVGHQSLRRLTCGDITTRRVHYHRSLTGGRGSINDVGSVYEVDRRQRRKLELGFRLVTISHSRSGFIKMSPETATAAQLGFHNKHDDGGSG
ncbi:hypothetical protein Hanom_Chr15g01402111 [Helianthus anomalus]